MQGIARRLVVSFMGVLLFVAAGHAAPRWENPLPQGNIIADVAWNGTRYVAVGNGGTILTSGDGTTWLAVSSGTTAWLEAVRWNEVQRQFIVAGNEGTLLTSPDGLRWTRRASGISGYLYGIANAGNLNVVVGSSGAVVTSSDGINWTVRNSGVLDWLNDVAWNGQEFIAIGGNGTIIASPDGNRWSRRDSTLRTADTGPSLESVAWSPQVGRWVAVTEFGAGNVAWVLWSGDGRLWQTVAAGDKPLRSVTWDPQSGRFVAVGGGGRVMVSVDGTLWDAPNDTGYEESLESVVAGGAGLVAAGEHGLLLTASDPSGAWTRRTSGPLAAMNGVAFDGAGYAAVGNGTIFHRGLPGTATADVIGQAEGTALPILRGIAWGTDGYVAVGDGGAILRSADGVTWSREATTGTALNGVTQAGDGSWYAVGAQGRVMRNDGQGWSVARSGTETLNAIAASGNSLVAVGTRGTSGIILTSTGGQSWTTRSFANLELRGVAAGDGRIVAVGRGGTVLVNEGGAWTVGNTGALPNLAAVTWDGGRFVAVGRDGSTFTSVDGTQWTARSVTGNHLYAVTPAGGGSFLVTGEGGTVIHVACPCANPDRAVTEQDQPVVIEVLANDSGTGLVVHSADNRTTHGGTVRVNGDGTLTYTPAAGFTGTDSFGYTLGSRADATARDIATVTVEVGRRSNPPGNDTGGGGGGALSLLFPLLWALTRRRPAVA